ncbi:hypothetical protein BSNK01_13890 [Bacillaceae bacterium]
MHDGRRAQKLIPAFRDGMARDDALRLSFCLGPFGSEQNIMKFDAACYGTSGPIGPLRVECCS